MEHFINTTQSFEVRNVQKKKESYFEERSPSIYSHINGYKFCVKISFHASICLIATGLYAMQGDNDKELKWPVEATFTLALLNQRGGEDRECTVTKIKWNRPREEIRTILNDRGILDYSELENFLYNDTLYFRVKVVNIK